MAQGPGKLGGGKQGEAMVQGLGKPGWEARGQREARAQGPRKRARPGGMVQILGLDLHRVGIAKVYGAKL